jgi:hypothetical protein
LKIAHINQSLQIPFCCVYYTPPQILKESSGSPQTPQGLLRTP